MIRRFTRWRVGRRPPGPLTLHILAVNMIAMLIPVLGLLFLGPYRDRLIEQELDALESQGEIFAGALGEGALSVTPNGLIRVDRIMAQRMIHRLVAGGGARARFFLASGAEVVDSRRFNRQTMVLEVEDLPEPGDESEFLAPLWALWERIGQIFSNPMEPHHDPQNAMAQDFPEARQALNGVPARSVRADDDHRLVLSVALPVQRYYRVMGVLLVSRAGDGVEAALREVRLFIGIIFAGALVLTVLLSFYLAGTIARPLRRLAHAAERVRRTVGREATNIPEFPRRQDEIGDLARSLAHMTQALQSRLTGIERFAADVAHELKNPLTSLRSAVETLGRVRNEGQRQKLLAVIHDDTERLDRLISDISDASRLDAELSRSEVREFDLAAMLRTMVEIHGMTGQTRSDGRPVTLRIDGDGNGGDRDGGAAEAASFRLPGHEERVARIVRNLIANGESFSPEGAAVHLILRRRDGMVELLCEDDGPGLPPSKLNAVFERFYSERPEGEKFGVHSGLGLSISRQIAEAHGGTLHAENRSDSHGRVMGARFVLRLPTEPDTPLP